MAAGAVQHLQDASGTLVKRVTEHNLTLVAAGVAFYAFLAFVPTIIIVVSVYGRIAPTSDIEQQVHSFARALPSEVERFIESQITVVSRADATGVSVTLVVALLIALWSASGGMAALMTGIRVAIGGREPETFLRKRGTALLVTIGAVVLLVVIVFLVAALPPLLSDLGFGGGGKVVANVLRWPLLLLLNTIGLGVIYHIVGDRSRSAWLGVVTPGSVTGAVVWLIASGVFAFYTANFSRYSRTYGTLTSIIVVLLWLYLSALSVLLGAEIDGLLAARRQPSGAPERTDAATVSTSLST